MNALVRWLLRPYHRHVYRREVRAMGRPDVLRAIQAQRLIRFEQRLAMDRGRRQV